MKPGVKCQVFLLAAIVFGVYYSALSAAVNSVDDSHIITAYGMGVGKGLAEIFRPGVNYYYRPLVELSYYLDNFLWGMDARSMHLENVLFHVFNTILVFLIARQLACTSSVKTPWFPLISAILFAVHPINTESVTWIAGRTDPLAGVFIFASIWCLLQCLITDRILYLWPSLLFFVLGGLTKEIALCFLPSAVLLTIYWPGEVRLRPTVLRVLAGIFFCGIIIVLTFIIFKRNFSVSAFLNSNAGGISTVPQTFFTSLGFYLKKLILPLPLNFAIDAVSPLYFIPGIAVLLLSPLWLKMRCIPALLAAVCFIFLFPALILSMMQVAWTPYAERYLYLPSAFFCIGFVSGGSLLLEKIQLQQWLPTLVLCVAAIAAFITVQRNFVWQDNLTLYWDTVSKSPGFGAVHLELGVALSQKGRLNEAQAEFELADRLNKRPSLRNQIKANLMVSRLQRGDYQGTREYFYRIFPHKVEACPDLLRILNKADEELASRAVDNDVRNNILRDMIDTYDILYRKTHDPFNLYQSGMIASRCGDNAKSLAFMRQTVREAPEDTHYTAAAKKWLHKLEARQ